MNNSNSEPEKTFSPLTAIEREWRAKFNELCYEVFYKNPTGAALLQHLENKFFRSPVAYPNRDPAFAFFNEGQNEMIRSFTAAIQGFIALSVVKETHAANHPVSKGRPRNPKIRPI